MARQKAYCVSFTYSLGLLPKTVARVLRDCALMGNIPESCAKSVN